jgi:phosphatidylglycerophosphate synthase
MLDGQMRRLIDPPLNLLGAGLSRLGISADRLTLLGLGCGLACALAILIGLTWGALLLLALSRLCDGLDGAVARASAPTDRGGFLDIVCDFAFYGAVPLAFALAYPASHALPAAFLLFTFYVNGASFLAFATLAAKRGLTTQVQGLKSFYFSVGLAEGTETIAVFALMILFPAWFPPLAWAFGALVLVTAGSRIILAWKTFAD